MSNVTDVRELSDHPFQRIQVSDVVLALGTTFDVEHGGDFDCLRLLNKDFLLFVNKYIPELANQSQFTTVVDFIHNYHLNRLQFSLHHQIRDILAEAVYGPLVYTGGCEHESLALDCIDFNVDDSFEKDAFDTAVKDGEIGDVLLGLQKMVTHLEKSYNDFMSKRESREWIFEDNSMIQGIHVICEDDIMKIANSIQLEFDTHQSSTLQYINEILMRKYFPVDLPELHNLMKIDVEKMVSKGDKIEYSDLCDFVAKYNLYKRHYE